MTLRLIYILSFLSLCVPTLASAGDRSFSFEFCLFRCKISQCDIASPAVLPISLRITRWSCLDNCKYVCMHEITTEAINNGEPVVQYYGKWPFWRFAGMQEPASVLFSILNLWAHVRGFSKVRKEIHHSHPLKRYFLIWSGTSINTWVWSAVFHTRDTRFTEKLDYFSAALTILTALYFTAIRIFHLYTPTPHETPLRSRKISHKTGLKLKLWTTLCAMVYIAHVSYLTLLPRFDYTYNVIFNLVIGLTHNALWLVYSLPSSISPLRRFPSRPSSYRPPFVSSAVYLVVFTTAATALELFDFPPVARTIDAHSLWHLCTVLIAIYWYRFLVADARDDSWREFSQRVATS
ncbi:Per1-like protein [Marasmius fiardii PR-910]|nr:Per1-like protein [Marasmius fiardii PR-910]